MSEPEWSEAEILYWALEDAINRAEIPEIIDLLEQGADINYHGYEGWTPLMSAAYVGVAEMVELLLSRGADPKSTNSKGQTALDLAQSVIDEGLDYGQSEVVAVLSKAVNS